MSNLKPGEFDVGGVRGKKVSLSHLAIPVLDVERSIAFYEKYLQMKVVKRRDNPVDVWMADGIRPFQLVLLAADKGDIQDNERAGPTDYRSAGWRTPSWHRGTSASPAQATRKSSGSRQWRRPRAFSSTAPARKAGRAATALHHRSERPQCCDLLQSGSWLQRLVRSGMRPGSAQEYVQVRRRTLG